MIVAGIDGCPAGWFGFSVGDDDKFDFGVFKSPDELVIALKADLYFIDMPIGLNETDAQRRCDTELRKLLPLGLKSSVFSPPVKAALHANTYNEACSINAMYSGKKISLQAWNIMPKIAALDSFLEDNPGYRKLFLESHPETAFLHLNNGNPLIHKKRKKAGLLERLVLLNQLWSRAEAAYEIVRMRTSRNQVRSDDIADAMVLTLAARRFYPGNYLTLPEEQESGVQIHVPQKKLPRV